MIVTPCKGNWFSAWDALGFVFSLHFAEFLHPSSHFPNVSCFVVFLNISLGILPKVSATLLNSDPADVLASWSAISWPAILHWLSILFIYQFLSMQVFYFIFLIASIKFLILIVMEWVQCDIVFIKNSIFFSSIFSLNCFTLRDYRELRTALTPTHYISEEFHSLYRSHNIIRMFNSIRLSWIGHVTRME